MLNVLFFGSSIHSLPTFNACRKLDNLKVVGVVTVEDKIEGRKKILTPNPVKVEAQIHNLPVFTPVTLKNNSEIIESISKLKPDLLVVAWYGLLIPKEILDFPCFGGLNIHPSLLPKYRGSSPGQWAILNGEKTSGVTIIKMSPDFDKGQIVAQQTIEMSHKNLKDFYTEAFVLGARLLEKKIADYLNNKITLKDQVETSNLTYARKLTKDDGHIPLNATPCQIERMTRALLPWPGVWLNVSELETLLDIKTNIEDKSTIIKLHKVKSFDNKLVIEKIQVAGEVVSSWNSFLEKYLN